MQRTIYIDSDDIIKEAIRIANESCYCDYRSRKEQWDELESIIQRRKNEPVDLGCID